MSKVKTSPPPRPFLALSLAFVGCVALGAWLALGPCTALPPPENFEEVRVVLQFAFPEGHHSPSGKASDGSFYFSLEEKTQEDLSKLLFAPEALGRWEGVVFCTRVKGAGDLYLEGFEGLILRWGNFVLFGDQNMLEALEKNRSQCCRK